MREKFITIGEKDNVAVALCDLKKGEEFVICNKKVKLNEDINFGHKFAIQNIKIGENIIKYNNPIGHAKIDISIGDFVHVHNVATNLSDKIDYIYNKVDVDKLPKLERKFMGYVRKNGKVGIRNDLYIIPTVGCVNVICEIRDMAIKQYANLYDNVIAIRHNQGCSQMGDDQEDTQKFLSGIIKNPNAAGVIVVSLGCENNNLSVFKPYLDGVDETRVKFLVAQEVDDEYDSAQKLLEELYEIVKTDKREECSLDKLVVGFKCGGSDGFSGLTANPLCGMLNDSLTNIGAKTILTEVPEMFGAEHILMNRAKDKEVFNDIVSLINEYKDYFISHNQVVYENPSPGNKNGGITTLEEKSLGCIQKGGHSTVTNVVKMACNNLKEGLNLLQGPGNDLVSCTNLVAAGANLILFTTGRGNPFGTVVPTMKISSNTQLYNHKKKWIDFDAGRRLEFEREKILNELIDYVIKIASGNEYTKNEKNGYQEISIFKSGVIL